MAKLRKVRKYASLQAAVSQSPINDLEAFSQVAVLKHPERSTLIVTLHPKTQSYMMFQYD